MRIASGIFFIEIPAGCLSFFRENSDEPVTVKEDDMLVSWKCNRCRVNQFLPASPPPLCGICRKPMVRQKAGAPPPVPPKRNAPPALPPKPGAGPPLPPRRRRPASPPPPATTVVESGRTPRQDFFTLYIPSLMRNMPVRGASAHRVHMFDLMGSAEFRKTGIIDNFGSVEAYARFHASRMEESSGSMSLYNVILKQVYCQSLDDRMYHNKHTASGWCLGIGSYWLKRKLEGVDIFPVEIFNHHELATAHSAPARLMANQDKLRKIIKEDKKKKQERKWYQKKVQDRVVIKDGMTGGIKIALDYIAGGQFKKGNTVQKYDMTVDPNARKGHGKNFYKTLAPRTASFEQRMQDLFLVTHQVKGGGGHLMALDMSAVEFFDPNFGIFTAANGSREKLIDFLFTSFYPLFYTGSVITSFKLYRIF